MVTNASNYVCLKSKMRFQLLEWKNFRKPQPASPTIIGQQGGGTIRPIGTGLDASEVGCAIHGGARCPGGGNGTAGEPPGRRALLVRGGLFSGVPCPLDDSRNHLGPTPACTQSPVGVIGPFFDDSLAAVAEEAEDFFAAYKMAGGDVDVIIVGQSGCGGAGLPMDWAARISGAATSRACARERWSLVERDARWPALLQDLRAVGFANTSSVDLAAAMQAGGQRAAFNAAVQRRLASYWARALLEPARRHFPSVRHSST